MLSGAEMSVGKGGSRQARISISRRRHSWPLLYWYMVLVHSHGIEMRIRGIQSTVRQGSITFSSTHNPLLVCAYNRWYQDAGKRLPLDIRIDQQTACVVLAGALRRWAIRGKESAPVRILTPPCHATSMESLISQLSQHLPVIGSKHTGLRGQIMVSVADAIAFVDGHVPQSVWNAT